MPAYMSRVFVDLDTQCDFLTPEGALPIPAAANIVDNLRALTRFAIDNGVPIISSISSYLDEASLPEGFAPHCMAGTPGALKLPETLTPDMLVIPNVLTDMTISYNCQLVLEKQGFDAFDNVNAGQVFGAFRVKNCVIYGVPTELTVQASVVRLRELGYDIHVVRDAILPLDPAAEVNALSEMAINGAKFINTNVLLENLRREIAG